MNEAVLEYEVQLQEKPAGNSLAIAIAYTFLFLFGVGLLITGTTYQGRYSSLNTGLSGVGAILGIFLAAMAAWPTVLFWGSYVLGLNISGSYYCIDNEKIYVLFLFRNKTFQKIFRVFHDALSINNIRGSSNIYLKTIKKIELREIDGQKMAWLEYERFCVPFRYHRHIQFPAGKETEYYTKLKHLVARASSGAGS